MVATTISIAPRAFIATAIEAASQKRSPPQMPPSVQPNSLPKQATPITTASMPPPPSVHRSTLQADDAEEHRRQHAEDERLEAVTVSVRMRGTWRNTCPATKAPNTA